MSIYWSELTEALVETPFGAGTRWLDSGVGSGTNRTLIYYLSLPRRVTIKEIESNRIEAIENEGEWRRQRRINGNKLTLGVCDCDCYCLKRQRTIYIPIYKSYYAWHSWCLFYFGSSISVSFLKVQLKYIIIIKL